MRCKRRRGALSRCDSLRFVHDGNRKRGGCARDERTGRTMGIGPWAGCDGKRHRSKRVRLWIHCFWYRFDCDWRNQSKWRSWSGHSVGRIKHCSWYRGSSDCDGFSRTGSECDNDRCGEYCNGRYGYRQQHDGRKSDFRHLCRCKFGCWSGQRWCSRVGAAHSERCRGFGERDQHGRDQRQSALRGCQYDDIEH